MQVYSNLKNYRLHRKEQSVDDLPFEWDKLSDVPAVAIKHGYLAVLVYAYIHSGISLSLTDFKDPWDSGIAGVLLFKHNAQNVSKQAADFVNNYNKDLSEDDYEEMD